MGSKGGNADNVEAPLTLGADGCLRPHGRGLPLAELARRDMVKLIEQLRDVSIRWNKMGDTAAKGLAAVLCKCPNVAAVDLADNFLGCMGCQDLCQAVFHHGALTSLNLSGNRIGDLGAAVLSSLLMTNTSLTHLDLSANKLERQAMQGIGGGLRGNSALRTLLLAENFFADEGAIEIGWAISYNHTLSTLSIRGNEITSAGANMMASGLSKNSGLVNLDLAENVISQKGVIKLAEALRTNTSLAELDLRHNSIATTLPFNHAQDAILDAMDFTHRCEPLSDDHRLAIAMALHPRLGEQSPLFLLTGMPVNELKAALDTQRNGGKVLADKDKKKLVAALMKSKDEMLFIGAAREERKRDGGTLNKERLAAAGIKASMGHDGEEQLVYLLPPSSYYEESTHGCHQLTADSPLRVVIAQAIHHRRRRILFDGQDPLTLVDPDLA